MVEICIWWLKWDIGWISSLFVGWITPKLGAYSWKDFFFPLNNRGTNLYELPTESESIHMTPISKNCTYADCAIGTMSKSINSERKRTGKETVQSSLFIRQLFQSTSPYYRLSVGIRCSSGTGTNRLPKARWRSNLKGPSPSFDRMV